MPKIIITEETLRLIGQQALPGYIVLQSATRREDGLWDLLLDEEVAARINDERLTGESDDDVVARLVRAATRHRPH